MVERKPNSKLERYYKQQGSRCYYCRESVDFSQITRDHILPRKDGHKLNGNSVFACRKCNGYKGHKTLEEFREMMLNRLVDMLRNVVKNGFKISQASLVKFRQNHTRLMSITRMINNNYKPIFK